MPMIRVFVYSFLLVKETQGDTGAGPSPPAFTRVYLAFVIDFECQFAVVSTRRPLVVRRGFSSAASFAWAD